jgi:hypothetical protein
LSGCTGAFNRVLIDFGLRPGPERGKQLIEGDVLSRLSHVTERELDRLNADPENVDIVFEKDPQSALGLGKFYKTVKVYEKAYPLDVKRDRARQVQRAETLRKRGYRGRVEYRYRMYRGEKFPSRDEARDGPADIRTDDVGREIYMYYFDEAAIWDGKPGRFDRRIEPAEGRNSSLSPARETIERNAGGERIEVGGTIRVRAESVDEVNR